MSVVGYQIQDKAVQGEKWLTCLRVNKNKITGVLPFLPYIICKNLVKFAISCLQR